MHLTTGPSRGDWQPAMTASTTDQHYWLNWRFALCALWALISIVVAVVLIWRYEGPRSRESPGVLYADQPWRPCLKEVHPAWLLAFRLVSFFVLLGLLVLIVIVDGGSIFYYYTQWTFILITVYFGLGSLLSIYGCHQYLSKVGGYKSETIRSDTERSTYMAPRIAGTSTVDVAKIPGFGEEHEAREIAGFWGYVFQIIYQTNAGAVMLTDCVFWFIIFPFLAIKDYNLNFLLVGMHSVNAIFLLCDTALNSLHFPWFRIAYFTLWTTAYVICQWIIHACISLWWPYPFLDLSSPRAPVWYLAIGLLQIPCYAVFPLLIKLKYFLLARWFPRSYHSEK